MICGLVMPCLDAIEIQETVHGIHHDAKIREFRSPPTLEMVETCWSGMELSFILSLYKHSSTWV